MNIQCGDKSLDLTRPVVMGILNTTPDSFSDGGSYYSNGRVDLSLVLSRAEQMLRDGADILDVGGESTRPGADPVSEQEELDRVVPVVEALCRELGALVSVDTSTPAVITSSAAVGCGIINDVRALQRPGAVAAAEATGLPVCLMHMQGAPDTMQQRPQYASVLDDVSGFLDERIQVCEAAGIRKDQIILDPGFGFGKTVQHNLDLLRGLDRFVQSGFPVLVGFSRKSMIGKILGRDVSERLAGSLALAIMSAQRGAHIFRVHDVAATRDVLDMYQAVEG